MSKKNILIVTSEFPPQPGGIGNHAYNLALQLSKNGYQVQVVCDDRSLDGQEEKRFDASLKFGVERVQFKKPRFLMYFNRVIALSRHIKKSHHVIATGKFSLWSIAFISFFFDRNYIAVIHGTEVNYKPFLLRKSIAVSLKRFNTVVAVSYYTKNLIQHLHLDVLVIPNGFDPEKWKPSILPSHSLMGNPKLITLGNVTSRKGQQNVIQHLPKLLGTFPELHYHCVGLNTEKIRFEGLARDLKVSNHITFHGPRTDRELQSLLHQADIMVMLSSETETGDVEGFGIALLEGNALGIPAIGSKGCGIEDAIKEGGSGLLVDPFDPDAFEDAIHAILKNRALFQSGAMTWAKHHEWTHIVHHYIQLLS